MMTLSSVITRVRTCLESVALLTAWGTAIFFFREAGREVVRHCPQFFLLAVHFLQQKQPNVAASAGCYRVLLLLTA